MSIQGPIDVDPGTDRGQKGPRYDDPQGSEKGLKKGAQKGYPKWSILDLPGSPFWDLFSTILGGQIPCENMFKNKTSAKNVHGVWKVLARFDFAVTCFAHTHFCTSK